MLIPISLPALLSWCAWFSDVWPSDLETGENLIRYICWLRFTKSHKYYYQLCCKACRNPNQERQGGRIWTTRNLEVILLDTLLGRTTSCLTLVLCKLILGREFKAEDELVHGDKSFSRETQNGRHTRQDATQQKLLARVGGNLKKS